MMSDNSNEPAQRDTVSMETVLVVYGESFERFVVSTLVLKKPRTKVLTTNIYDQQN